MIQIQPKLGQLEEWKRFADREDLVYEVIGLPRVTAVLPEEEREPYIRWFADSERSVSMHGAFIDINPVSGDPDIAGLSRKKIAESCSIAKRIGADNIVFHGSCFQYLRGQYFDTHVRLAAEYYREIAEMTGLNIFIENSFDLDPDPMEQIVCLADHEKVRCCLDIGHANYSRVPVKGWFDQLGDKIGYLHLSDNFGRFDDHVAIGEGNIDWEETDRLYRDLGRDIPVTLETGDLEQTKQSYLYLKERGFFI